jgi:beta-galactosidase
LKLNFKAYLPFSTHFCISGGSICLFFLIILFSTNLSAQIKVFERTKNEALNNETIFQSDKRIKINLNGDWSVSFDNSDNSTKISVPFATDYVSSINLRKDINIPDSLLSKYNFIFYSEGINYESEVKINDVIISRNTGGCKFIFNEIQENTLKSTNTISIKINGELNNSGTFPLSSQVNYARNYNGLLSNIYIYAVPKIYISETLFNYTFQVDNSITLINKININTLNIDSLISDGNNFFIRTEIYRKSDSAKLFESPLSRLEAKSYQNYKIVSSLNLRNIDLWSAENPSLYIIKTSVLLKEDLIDNIIYETGFKKVKLAGPDLYVNDIKIKLKGLNYFEDLPSFAGAMDYTATEKDLRNIKDLGFNCLRVPGKSAHPFVVKIAQRIGLYVLQEYPFNEVPSELLSNDKFVKNALDYFENIVKRDLHSPAVLFWGI